MGKLHNSFCSRSACVLWASLCAAFSLSVLGLSADICLKYLSAYVLLFTFPVFHYYIVLPESSIEVGVVAKKKKKKPKTDALLGGKNSSVFTVIIDILTCSCHFIFNFHFYQVFFLFPYFLAFFLNGEGVLIPPPPY